MATITATTGTSNSWIKVTNSGTSGDWTCSDVSFNAKKSKRPTSLEGKPNLKVPKHWPRNFNKSSPCDMMQGPCSCGAWHSEEDKWVKENLEKYGKELSLKDYKPVFENGEYRWVKNS